MSKLSSAYGHSAFISLLAFIFAIFSKNFVCMGVWSAYVPVYHLHAFRTQGFM